MPPAHRLTSAPADGKLATSPPLVEKYHRNLCTVGAEVKMMLHRSTINSSPMETHSSCQYGTGLNKKITSSHVGTKFYINLHSNSERNTTRNRTFDGREFFLYNGATPIKKRPKYVQNAERSYL